MEKLSEAEAAKLAEVRTMLEARGLSTVGRKVSRFASLFAFGSQAGSAGGIDRAVA
jgi:hypothetical protein